jgi:hypothetical protein
MPRRGYSFVEINAYKINNRGRSITFRKKNHLDPGNGSRLFEI